MTIGEKIRDLRTKKDMTMDDLARAAKTSFQNIHRYETGIITNIPLSKIELIAKALEVEPADLLGWSHSNGNEKAMAARERLRRSPGMRTLFNAVEDATEEELESYARMIKAFRGDDE